MRRRHRHERWLHARIPEELEDALKREALRRRWPVSTLVRDVRFVEIPGAGHMVHFDRPRELLAALRTFLLDS